ncbi:MAG TPA: DUF5990 family protein [Caulobacteraceae bacterium]|nr:DUF5990 family protein [Caulobacteraceae bacterium]
MAEELRLRLIRKDDAPATNPLGDAFEFGLQDTKGALAPAHRLTDGRLYWDFELRVQPGKGGRPNFLGRFASGPADDRFVYLAWRSIPRGVWINRVKARLADIDWPLIEEAQGERAQGRDGRLVADISAWGPGGGRRAVDWRLA